LSIKGQILAKSVLSEAKNLSHKIMAIKTEKCYITFYIYGGALVSTGGLKLNTHAQVDRPAW